MNRRIQWVENSSDRGLELTFGLVEEKFGHCWVLSADDDDIVLKKDADGSVTLALFESEDIAKKYADARTSEAGIEVAAKKVSEKNIGHLCHALSVADCIYTVGGDESLRRWWIVGDMGDAQGGEK